MTPPATGSRTIEARDLFRLRMADDPQLSPDGRTLAWVETRMDPEENRYVAELRLAPREQRE